MAAMYRNVMQAIVDKHFSNLHPHTFPCILQEASNGQAQHQAHTHDTSYAVDEISDGVGLPLSARDGQFLVSRAFHVWYRFTPEAELGCYSHVEGHIHVINVSTTSPDVSSSGSEYLGLSCSVTTM